MDSVTKQFYGSAALTFVGSMLIRLFRHHAPAFPSFMMSAFATILVMLVFIVLDGLFDLRD